MLPNAKMLGNLCWHEGEVLSKRRWEGKTCGIASRARDGLLFVVVADASTSMSAIALIMPVCVVPDDTFASFAWNIRFNIHAIINVIALNTSRESMSPSSFVTTCSPPQMTR
eukprot:scaffold37369_cov124-Skeletonema_marinoi.AAC.1